MNSKIVVEAQMMIRRPVSEVFNAFVDPGLTKNFWFNKSSGKLEAGSTVIWEWEMYGVKTNVFVKGLIPNKEILIEWGDPVTTVEFDFEVLSEFSTLVKIKNYGFELEGNDLIEAVKDNTGGFTTVLDGLKAYMEQGCNLNLIADKFPKK